MAAADGVGVLLLSPACENSVPPLLLAESQPNRLTLTVATAVLMVLLVILPPLLMLATAGAAVGAILAVLMTCNVASVWGTFEIQLCRFQCASSPEHMMTGDPCNQLPLLALIWGAM